MQENNDSDDDFEALTARAMQNVSNVQPSAEVKHAQPVKQAGDISKHPFISLSIILLLPVSLYFAYAFLSHNQEFAKQAAHLRDTWWILPAIGLLYFVPALIAICQNSPRFVAILALNLLLGWTCIGWVVALIWSLIPTKQK